MQKEYALDAERIWNLDETGASPGRDANGSMRHKRFLRRNARTDVRLADFSFTKRITIMLCVSAAGACAPALLVYNGQKIPYREVLQDEKISVETLSDCLPRGSLLYARNDGSGVNNESFLKLAHHFTEHVKDLTTGDRKVLLTLDGYRSHMNVHALLHFEKHSVRCYAIPAHRSGKTQPADVRLFGSFKRQLNSIICLAADPYNSELFTVLDFARMITSAYYSSFARSNIESSFRRSGVWPVQPSRLLNSPRPKDDYNLERIMSVEELEALMVLKRRTARSRILGQDVQVLRTGFIGTKHGALLNSAHALKVAMEKLVTNRIRRIGKEVQRERRVLRAEEKKHLNYCSGVKKVCRLQSRLVIARVRTLEKNLALARGRNGLNFDQQPEMDSANTLIALQPSK